MHEKGIIRVKKKERERAVRVVNDWQHFKNSIKGPISSYYLDVIECQVGKRGTVLVGTGCSEPIPGHQRGTGGLMH